MSALLAVDGDSFAHRAYHGLPKTVPGRRPAGAIIGFANMLTRLWEREQPDAVLVAWDTLDVPTYRHEAFAAYQSGREFDEALLEQLALLPDLVARMRLRGREGARLRGGRLPRRRGAAAEAGRTCSSRPPTGTRSSSSASATTILQPVRASASSRASARPRCASATASIPRRCRTSSRSAATRPTSLPGARGIGPKKAADVLAAVRLARGRAGGRTVRGGGGGVAALPANSDARRLRPSPSPRRPNPDVGGGVSLHSPPRDSASSPAGSASPGEELIAIERPEPSGVRARSTRPGTIPSGPSVSRCSSSTSISGARAAPRRRRSFERCHDAGYVERVRAIRGTDVARRATRPAPRRRFEAALLSAGAAIEAACCGGFALVRPPGPPRARGPRDGLLHLQQRRDRRPRTRSASSGSSASPSSTGTSTTATAPRTIFWDDDACFFVSLHQWPFYPGSGGPDEQAETT